MSGRYEVKELVGAGGMADVYVGHDRMLDRDVALKRLRGSVADPAARERFTREAQLLAGFTHPNSVKVYDALEDAEGPYIVMELVDGETLRQYMRRRGGKLAIPEAVAIADQLLAALGAAHARGIVHRDVKPANVMITPDGHVKLADFGIATMSDATELTLHGQVVGTPKYLSPEQALGEKATPASDLYAVGVMLYEMAAGRAPFDAETSAATLAAHSQAPVPSLADARPDAPDWYVAVVERALAKHPAERFPDAGTMRAALIAGESGVPTELVGAAAAPTATLPLPALDRAEPASPFVRPERPPWLVPALIAFVALLVVMAVWAFGGWGGDAGVPRPGRTTSVGNVIPTVPATTPPTAAPTLPPTVGPKIAVPGPGKVPPGQKKKGEDQQG